MPAVGAFEGGKPQPVSETPLFDIDDLESRAGE
jgi:hypothetical protein